VTRDEAMRAFKSQLDATKPGEFMPEMSCYADMCGMSPKGFTYLVTVAGLMDRYRALRQAYRAWRDAEAERLLRQGRGGTPGKRMGCEAVAQELGMNRGRVQDIARAIGAITPRALRLRWDVLERLAYDYCAESPRTMRQIQAHLGVQPSSLRSYLSRGGMPWLSLAKGCSRGQGKRTKWTVSRTAEPPAGLKRRK
jgi:hypothetical protein